MKSDSALRRLFFAAAIALVVTLTGKAEDLYLIQKSQGALQRGLTTVVPNNREPFGFVVSSPVFALLTIPGGATIQLVEDTEEGGYFYERYFPSKAALDAAFPDGTYSLALSGGPTLSIPLVGNLYPAIPQVVGGNWNANGMLLLNPSPANTITFTPHADFATRGAVGYQFAEVGSFNGAPGYFYVNREAMSRPLPFVSGESKAFTTLTVNAGSLTAGTVYYGNMEHAVASTVDTTTLPGNLITGVYSSMVTFHISAVSSGNGGNPPVIVTQPSNVTGTTGGTATFTLSATVGGINFNGGVQWFFNGREIGPTAAGKYTFSQNGLQLRVNTLRDEDAGTYGARLFNSGGVRDSNLATLTLPQTILPTTITTQPAGRSLIAGQSTTLSVVGGGSSPFQYAWLKDGVLIEGATTANLLLSAVSASSAGNYQAAVSARGGTVLSQIAVVAVQSAPTFSQQPLDTVVEAGLNAAFSVTVTGSPAPTLQWFSRVGTGPWTPVQNGSSYNGANQRVLSINAVTTAQDGLQFQVRAVNSTGSVDSAIATLRVSQTQTALRITGQPQSQIVRAGQPATFAVSMDVGGPYTYQWRKDGATLSGATTDHYTVPEAGSSDAGVYSVIVRDAKSSIVTSNSAELTVAGAVDANFDPRGGPDGEITQMITLRDGSYLVAGSFVKIAGVARVGLAKLGRDGSVDVGFNAGTGPNGAVQALLELAGGKFLVVGQFDRFNGSVVPGLARVQSTGQLDPTFIPDLPLPPVAGQTVPALERFHFAALSLSGGGYLLGGKSGMVALTVSGTQIPQSLYFADGAVRALVQQFDGGIIAGGDFATLSGFPRPRLSRFLADFRMDLTFNVGTGPNGAVQTLQRSLDGWIYVMGVFTQFNGAPRASGIARIGPKGQLDESYNPQVAPVVASSEWSSTQSASITPAGGRLDSIRAGRATVDGGLVVTSGPSNNQSVQVVGPNGVVSPDVDVDVAGSANTLTLTSEGDIGVGGSYSSVGGTPRNNVAVVTDATEGSRLVNLSCRSRVNGDSSGLVLGFVIGGPDAMRVLVRGVGPSLQRFGISAALSQPKLTLYDHDGHAIRENISWSAGVDSAALNVIMTQVGAFELTSPNDTAVVLNLSPGSYTAYITGRNGTQGVALGEIYAVDNGRSRLINSAVQGAVGTGEDLLVPGFTVMGGSRMMLVRAIGPSLAGFGVPGTLQRPAMVLRRSSGELVASNQGWSTGFDPAALQLRSDAVGAFAISPQSADSAVLVGLGQGGHTVTVSGVDGGVGNALVEVYDANGNDLPPLNP